MVPAMSRPNIPTNRLWSAVSALLLFVVAAHAVEPMRADHQRIRGSAFSASTEEVSLKAATQAPVAKELVRLEPMLPPQPVETIPAERSATAAPPAFVSRDHPPLVADPALHPISPRAPPFA